MPQKMSIEVVKHSDGDVRVIFKDHSCTHRETFSTSAEAYSYISHEINCSSIFRDTYLDNFKRFI